MSRLAIERASRVLGAGGVVAYPTEAVWGLGCEPENPHAFVRLLSLKRRPLHKGVILIAADYSQLEPYLGQISSAALKPVLKSWPGPSTWLLPAAARTPAYLTGGRDTLAVRVTAHPLAAALCRRYGGAIVSTSANVSDRPAARSALHVRRYFDDRLDAILNGDTGGMQRPTPIRELATGKLLRS